MLDCFCYRTQSRWCCRWTYSWVWEILSVFTMDWENMQNAFYRVSLTITTTDEPCWSRPRDRWASSTTPNHTALDTDSTPPTRSLILGDADKLWYIMFSICIGIVCLVWILCNSTVIGRCSKSSRRPWTGNKSISSKLRETKTQHTEHKPRKDEVTQET